MFSLVSGLYEEYFSPPQINLLIVGAQGSGKTALMERMKVIDFSKPGSTATTTTTTITTTTTAKETSNGERIANTKSSSLTGISNGIQTRTKKKHSKRQKDKPRQRPVTRPKSYTSTTSIKQVPRSKYVFFPELTTTLKNDSVKSTDPIGFGIVGSDNATTAVVSTDDDDDHRNGGEGDDEDNDTFTNQSIGMSSNDDDDNDDDDTLDNDYSTISGGTMNSKKKIALWKNAKLAIGGNQHDNNYYGNYHDEDDGDTFTGDEDHSLKKSRYNKNIPKNHHEIVLHPTIHDEIHGNRRNSRRILHRRGSGISDTISQTNGKVKSSSGTATRSTTSSTALTTTTTTIGTTSNSSTTIGGADGGGVFPVPAPGDGSVNPTVIIPAITAVTTTTTTSTSSTTPVTTVSRSWYSKFCPAPQRYKKYDDDQDEEEVNLFNHDNNNDDDDDEEDEDDDDDDDDDDKHTNDVDRTSLPLHKDNKIRPENFNESFGDESMESIEFDDTKDNGNRRRSLSRVQEGEEDVDNDDDDDDDDDDSCEFGDTTTDGISDLDELQQHQQHDEYDLKLNSKMLPLHKINRTIGMNLTKKLSISSANVSVWDLGGKLSDLWERYYSDADAVLFVWKMNINEIKMRNSKEGSNDDDSGDGDEDRSKIILSSEHQLMLLEKVRDSVPDDVPFVILGHLFDPATIKDQKEQCKQQQQQQRKQQRRRQLRRRRYNKILQFCKTDQLYSITTLLPNHPVVNNCQGIFFGNASTGKGIKTAIEWTIRSAKIQQKIRQLQ